MSQWAVIDSRFPVIRILAGLNLALLAGLLTISLAVRVTEFTDAAHWWRQSKANEFEWARCETKHRTLLKQIKNEGLWARLGMPGQAWLQ